MNQYMKSIAKQSIRSFTWLESLMEPARRSEPRNFSIQPDTQRWEKNEKNTCNNIYVKKKIKKLVQFKSISYIKKSS